MRDQIPTLEDPTVDNPNTPANPYFERYIARLLLVLYHCGRPISSLLDGEIRQVDSIRDLQRFDFWVREPGHLALALLDTAMTTDDDRRDVVNRLMIDHALDVHRVALRGTPYNYLEDFDLSLSFLTSRALVSDRPSFQRGKSHGHQIVLESAGIEVARQIMAECPSYDWYRVQCETVARYFQQLDLIDLTLMTYLKPDLSLVQAASIPLAPTVRARFDALFSLDPTSSPETP